MPTVGETYGSYTLVRRLGRGGFGEVWLANWISPYSTTLVAVKFSTNPSPSLVNEVTREASLWSRVVNHPNVIRFLEANEYSSSASGINELILVTEFAPNGSLQNWLNNRGGSPASVEQTYVFIRGTLQGLTELHNNQIIHRDLKPDNLLLKGETVAIADFGLARFITAISRGGAGTPFYMSPEALRGQHSEAADIWAVGIIFYQLLIGNLPFYENNYWDLSNAIVNDPLPNLPVSIPSVFKVVITRALEKSPSQRYHTANIMLQALDQAWDLYKKATLLAGLYLYDNEHLLYIDENLNNGHVGTVGLRDEEIMGPIFGQLRLLIPGAILSSNQREILHQITIHLESKLSAVKYHLQQYEKIQDYKIRELNFNTQLLTRVQIGARLAEPGLTNEFESFSYQVTSTLNILITLLRPIFNIPREILRNFPRDGSTVTEFLEQLRNSNRFLSSRLDTLIDVINNIVIWYRDSFYDSYEQSTYKRSTLSISFSWDVNTSNLINPLTNDGVTSIHQLLKDTFHHLLLFCRDIIQATLVCTLPQTTSPQVLTDQERVQIGQAWNMNLTQAEHRLGVDIITEYNENGYIEARTRIEGQFAQVLQSDRDPIIRAIYNYIRSTENNNQQELQITGSPSDADIVITSQGNRIGADYIFCWELELLIPVLRNAVEQIRGVVNPQRYSAYRLYVCMDSSEDFNRFIDYARNNLTHLRLESIFLFATYIVNYNINEVILC